LDIHRPLATLCADVGSVAKRTFGWAGILVGPEHKDLRSGSEITRLAETVASQLNAGVPVALGFVCPLYDPVSQDPARLTAARVNEGQRAWSAGGGIGALATRLTETAWHLRRVRKSLTSSVEECTSAHVDRPSCASTGEGLFSWKAFVSDTGKGESSSHVGNAQIAIRQFMR
jgi:hypothetical protein